MRPRPLAHASPARNLAQRSYHSRLARTPAVTSCSVLRSPRRQLRLRPVPPQRSLGLPLALWSAQQLGEDVCKMVASRSPDHVEVALRHTRSRAVVLTADGPGSRSIQGCDDACRRRTATILQQGAPSEALGDRCARRWWTPLPAGYAVMSTLDTRLCHTSLRMALSVSPTCRSRRARTALVRTNCGGYELDWREQDEGRSQRCRVAKYKLLHAGMCVVDRTNLRSVFKLGPLRGMLCVTVTCSAYVATGQDRSEARADGRALQNGLT